MNTARAATGRWALVATASVDGQPVSEVRVPQGRALVAGPDGALCVPVPRGAPWIVQARWTREGRVALRDGRGQPHQLEPGEELRFHVGPVAVAMRLVAERPLRRTAPVAWSASLSWFIVVCAASLIVMQVDVVVRNLCPWFGIDCPIPQDASGWNAEYLGRLLREDVDGSERGVVVQEAPDFGVQTELPHAYMPAGDIGTERALGGSDVVADRPVRTEGREARARREERAKAERPPTPEVPEGTPLAPADEAAQDGAADPSPRLDEADEVAQDGGEERAEDTKGWGVRDWIDIGPSERERLEQEFMKQYAKERLRIDPDNPHALSLLAYYQYLSEDLAGASETYDKLLSISPEDAAAYNNKALIYKRQGRYDEEEGLYRVALSLDPDDTTALNNLAVNLAHQGRHEEALAIMERLEVALPEDPYSDLHRAKIHASRGDEDEALRFLRLALEGMARLDTLHHIEFRQDIRVDPAFDKLRQDPRFHAILKAYYGEDNPLGGAD